ncbi:MAG: hypothetical protein GY796_08745 [Chloroflexi bacterium]|nr:hypothetical protein [Chloroflexota bacterium]
MQRKVIVSTAVGTLILVIIWLGGCNQSTNAVRIDVDTAVTYQTITGWEAVAQAGQLECPGFANYQNELFDLAVQDLGINRLRLELGSGAENPADSFAQMQAGELGMGQWLGRRYESRNDNDDPNLINPTGFHFSELDFTMEQVVLPMRERLAAQGETLYINLTLVDFKRDGDQSDVHYQDAPEEYAELILAAFLHLQEQYGFVPDGVEMILEPDVAGWQNGRQVGNALVAAGNKLQDHGFQSDFIAPSNTDMGRAIAWFDEMMTVPGAEIYLTELAYHRYRGVSHKRLQAIADRAEQYNIQTAMLEHIGSGVDDLHEDLTVGQNSAWEQFALAFCLAEDDGSAYFLVGDGRVQLSKHSQFLRQYFRFVRRGAVRVAASSSRNEFDPVAFVDRNGRVTLIIKADRSSEFQVEGLPEGEYGVMWTTDKIYGRELPIITLLPHQTLTIQLPEKGVLTVYPHDDINK